MKKNASLFLTLLLFSLGLATSSLAMEPLILKEGWQKEFPGYHLEFLEDSAGAYGIDDVLDPEMARKFFPSESKSPNFGMTTSVYWGKFDLMNRTPSSQEFYLELQHLSEQIDFYLVKDGSVLSHKVVSRNVPFTNREIKFHNKVFHETIPAGETLTISLRSQSRSQAFVSTLLASDAFQEFLILDSLFFGFVYGIVLVMAFYNLFIYFFLRDKAYFYYVVFFLSAGLASSEQNGYAFQYLWPNSPWWEMHSIPVLSAMALVCAIVFVNSFLRIRTVAPRLYRFSKVLVAAFVLQIPIAFFDITVGIKVFIAISLVTIITIISSGIIALMNGYTPARYFLVAWTVLCIGLLLRIFDSIGLFTVSFFSLHGTQIAFAFDAVVLSLALADRINMLRAEKLQAQNEMLEAQRLHTEELEQKVAERTEELTKAMAIAESANKSKSEFLSIMSHEIRTPLNPIIGLTHLLLQTNLDGRQRDYVGKIESASKSLLGIIKDILDFSKIEAGKLDLEEVEFKLSEVVKDLSGLYSARFKEKNVEFSCSFQDGVPNILFGDSLRLGQVLSNFVSNAIKFTEKGTIHVGIEVVAKTPERVQLRFFVRDTGIGIPLGMQKKLFQSFVQVDASTTRKYGGTGLGLSICSRLVNMMGGEISLESETGKGSTFSFILDFTYIDAAVDVEMQLTPSFTHESPLFEGSFNPAEFPVLVVDDNEVNQMVARELLKGYGFPVLLAGSGNAALELLRQERVVLVLMDIEMPEMDGYETTKRIRNAPDLTDLPIIALTAHAMDEIRQKCLDAGMNDLITKPIEPPKLFEILSRWFSFQKGKIPLSETGEMPMAGKMPDEIPGIDIKALSQNTFGDEAFLLELLQEFQKRHKNDVVEIRKQILAGNAEMAATIAHRLVGGAAAIYASDLTRCAKECEVALNNNEGEIDVLVAEADEALQSLNESIQSFMGNSVSQ